LSGLNHYSFIRRLDCGDVGGAPSSSSNMPRQLLLDLLELQ
jgi:hypothetical protein